jgi:hypothetical protein
MPRVSNQGPIHDETAPHAGEQAPPAVSLPSPPCVRIRISLRTRIRRFDRAAGADVWLARYDPRTIEVAVRHGENSGRTLPHKDVVREMILLGHWCGEAAIFPVPASEAELAEAAIVQAAESGPILAAAKR